MKRNLTSRHRFVLLTAGLSCLGGLSVQAQDPVDFVVINDADGLTRDLRAASILLQSVKAKDVAALDLFADARAEYGRLLAALYARGHYGAVIHVLLDGHEAADIAPLDAPSRISAIQVQVDPGPVFDFDRAEIGPLAGRTVLPEGFALGKVAASDVIVASVQAGVDGWRAKGNAKAAVATQDIVADHDTSLLAAHIVLAPGPVLRFGPLAIAGNQAVRLERVRAIAGYPEGTRFDPAQAARVAERLRRTGAFSSVALAEDDAITRPDLLGMSLTLIEAKQHRYTFGAEISSSEGAVVSGSWLHRNFFGGGERFEISGSAANIGAETGGIDTTFAVTLDRPATPWPDTTLNLGFALGHLNEADYSADTAQVNVGFTQYFTTTLTGKLGVGYEFIRGRDAAGGFAYRSLELPIGLTWDRRDSKTDPTRVLYAVAEVKPFYGFGSTDNGLRLSFDTRAYKALGADDKLILAARLQGGAVLGASLLGTPRDDLFYAGGGGTVRGQPYQSLGVTVPDGGAAVTLGGNAFVAGSVEARLRVNGSFGGVAFLDMGVVGNGGLSAGQSDWLAGAGLGLRYMTPIGPIRLDVALPVHGNIGTGPQIYVGLGQAF